MYLPGKEKLVLSGCYNVLFIINYTHFCFKGKECHAWVDGIRNQRIPPKAA